MLELLALNRELGSAGGQGRILRLRTGDSPPCVAEISVCEQLEGAPAGGALEVVFNHVSGPLRSEEILKRTGALGHDQFTVVYSVEKPVSEFKILARLVEAEALHEPVALSARSHCMSVPLWPTDDSHAEGAWVMLPKRHSSCPGISLGWKIEEPLV